MLLRQGYKTCEETLRLVSGDGLNVCGGTQGHNPYLTGSTTVWLDSQLDPYFGSCEEAGALRSSYALWRTPSVEVADI